MLSRMRQAAAAAGGSVLIDYSSTLPPLIHCEMRLLSAVIVLVHGGHHKGVENGRSFFTAIVCRSQGSFVEYALKATYDKRSVPIAAAGNAGPKSAPLIPGADAYVIAVTADRLFSRANTRQIHLCRGARCRPSSFRRRYPQAERAIPSRRAD
jgi:hypothetical protein